jgi:molybdopterin-guanine dinucleotide biosynthesis protein A
MAIGNEYVKLTHREQILLRPDTYVGSIANEIKDYWYFNNETNFREPLLAIYHKNDLEKLLQFYKNGNTSLQQFLNEIEAVKIIPSDLKNITSVDTLIDFEKFKTNNFQTL